MDGPIRAVASRLVMLVFAFSTAAGSSFAQQPTQAQVNAIRQACRSDYQTYCANVPTGGSAALGCLKENAQSLSAPCQQAVGAVGGAAPAPQRQAPAAAAPGTPAPTATAPATPAYRALRHPKGLKHRRGKRSISCAAPAVPIIGPCAAMCRSAAVVS
jgi:Cysteine rich repeat